MCTFIYNHFCLIVNKIVNATDRFVLFYCDECDLLIPAINIFRDVSPEVIVHTTSNLDDLFERAKKSMPALILIYMNNPSRDYMELVKKIRSNTTSTSVPVLVYKVLPGDEEMRAAFMRIESMKDSQSL